MLARFLSPFSAIVVAVALTVGFSVLVDSIASARTVRPGKPKVRPRYEQGGVPFDDPLRFGYCPPCLRAQTVEAVPTGSLSRWRTGGVVGQNLSFLARYARVRACGTGMEP